MQEEKDYICDSMKTHIYGTEGNPSLMLLPGLGVSYEMFLPLISLLEDRFHIVAVEVFDGMNHGQLLADRPQDVASRIIGFTSRTLG